MSTPFEAFASLPRRAVTVARSAGDTVFGAAVASSERLFSGAMISRGHRGMCRKHAESVVNENPWKQSSL